MTHCTLQCSSVNLLPTGPHLILYWKSQRTMFHSLTLSSPSAPPSPGPSTSSTSLSPSMSSTSLLLSPSPLGDRSVYPISHRSGSSHRGVHEKLGPNDLVRFPHRDRSLGTPVRKTNHNGMIFKDDDRTGCHDSDSYGICP